MKTFKLIISGLCLVGTTLLVAETLPITGPLPFTTYDKDNNQVITVKEFNAIKQQRINQKVKDGRLMKNTGKSPVFSDIDTNADGIISKKELTIHQQNRFTKRTNQQNSMKKGMGKGQGRNY